MAKFEYVFFFLFRTRLPTQDGKLLEEPKSLSFDKNKQTFQQNGIPVDGDKRLFLKTAPPNSTDWKQDLATGRQEICQFYAQHFASEEEAQHYCQQALFGVALLILDDGVSVDHHSVLATVNGSEVPFIKTDEVLFRIGNLDNSTVLYRFKSNTNNLCLSFADEALLTPFEPGEFSPNSVFLVCGFSYGTLDHDAVETLLVDSKPVPLLAVVFARLIMGQWQFERINEEARLLRSWLQPKINQYSHYAKNAVIPECSRTVTLENQLQDMQSYQNDARFLLTRLDGALQTLDINADNLATRLEKIRVAQADWQISFQEETEKVQWLGDKKSVYHEPLLEIFHSNIKRLQDHKVYLQQQFDYLVGLQEKWRLYLGKRQSLSNEHLNTVISLLIILLAGGSASFTINRGAFGLGIENQIVLWIVITIAVVPVIWHFSSKLFKFVYCIFQRLKR
ncbi:hypothetical protein [Candidatus Parabeggiatoa sp. HSG14]|uniref:hypothetical protein n=1 Tax=Candidatus Parabeggiatoa sp. HSG14 TaxID=3055593 RepID=UPI0025A8744A|nr:hypothetical protein [Thiotrichales bacterium HSG14]